MTRTIIMGRFELTFHYPVIAGRRSKRMSNGDRNKMYQNIFVRSFHCLVMDYWLLRKMFRYRGEIYHLLGGFLPHVRRVNKDKDNG